jgi:threonine synthase
MRAAGSKLKKPKEKAGTISYPLPINSVTSHTSFPAPLSRSFTAKTALGWSGNRFEQLRTPLPALQDVRTTVKYISTRGQAPAIGFSEAVLAGLARDGGLYLPETYPQLSRETIAGFAGKSFAEVAVEVICPFTGGGIARDELYALADDAYKSFGHAAVTPLVQIAPDTFVLELFHGPTLAFKDVAMQLIARLMDHILAQSNQRATIVGATSGDTGGAAIEAFRGSKRVDIVILFPEGRVSDVQRRMMTTPAERNVHAVSIDGTFDDCQALVKAMFNDHAFRDRVQMSGVNSINWARIVAQVTYYFVAAAALGAPHRSVTFAVPTGNFGDIYAGYVAKRMGLQVTSLLIASNENDILPRTVASGVYEMKGVHATSSPSMDIQISSNFERYLFEASSRNADLIRAQMGSLAQSGRFDVGAARKNMQVDFTAAAATEIEVASAIRDVRARAGYLMDPHTACAYVALQKTRKSGTGPQVILATAHPAKFPDAMQVITGTRPALPPRLSKLMTDPERFTVVKNDLASVQDHVAQIAMARAGSLA